MKKAFTLAVAAALATTVIAPAQDAPAPAEGQRPERRPASPLVAALDANKDGVIDADEIAKSSEALKSLDKDGDGKLTREELAPERRGKRAGERGGPGKRGPRPEKSL